MQMPARARTALVALVELASRDDCCARPVTLADIACGRSLSQAYLEQLFCRLRRAGLVTSARGPGGGYRLARPAAELSIADIVRAVEDAAECLDPAPSDGCQRAQALWQALAAHMDGFLCRITLEDVVCHRVTLLADRPAVRNS